MSFNNGLGGQLPRIALATNSDVNRSVLQRVLTGGGCGVVASLDSNKLARFIQTIVCDKYSGSECLDA